MDDNNDSFLLHQVPTPSSIEKSMLVVKDKRQDKVEARREAHPPTRPVAHPEMRYYESRVLRDDTHEVFEWTKAYPLDKVDDVLGDVVMDMAKDDREVIVRRTANRMSRQVSKLGYKGALELSAKVGYLLEHLSERGE